MSGWVSIQRKLLKGEHPFFKKEPMTEAQAFGWMIASAVWEDTTHEVGGEVLSVPRGSFMTTLREMQGGFMWRSDKRVRAFLNRLENGRMIGRSKVGPRNAEKTHVTICNYDDYQSPGRSKDAAKTQRGNPGGRTKETNKQITNNNNPAGLSEILDSWAEKINGSGYVPPSCVSSSIANALVQSGRVTPEKMKERGIAA